MLPTACRTSSKRSAMDRRTFMGTLAGSTAGRHRSHDLKPAGPIVAFAARQKVPAIYWVREFADAGGLVGYGPCIHNM
jgi:hypothetical protein